MTRTPLRLAPGTDTTLACENACMRGQKRQHGSVPPDIFVPGAGRHHSCWHSKARLFGRPATSTRRGGLRHRGCRCATRRFERLLADQRPLDPHRRHALLLGVGTGFKLTRGLIVRLHRCGSG